MERYRTTIILVAVLVVLGGLAIVLGGKQSPVATGEPTPTPAQFIWQSDAQVVGIDVVSGTNKVSLTKDVTTTVWSLTAPIQATADPFAVGNIADSLKSLEATSVITGTDLAQFKLDKPVLTVTATFSDTAHTKRVLQVGAATFNGSTYYAKLPDQPSIYIVSNSVIEPLKSWLETPPKFVPTPAPLLPTVAPTSAISGTQTVTGTVGAGRVSPPPSRGTGTPGATTSGSGTPTSSLGTITPIGASDAITSTSLGAANATTPVITPLIATATALP